MDSIGIGFYSGLGDIVSAIPSLREASKKAKVYVFVKDSLLDESISFLNKYVEGCVFVPFSRKISLLPFLVKYFRDKKITSFLVSCHPPVAHSSSFIPPFLWFIRFILMYNLTIIGEKQDRFSFFYTKLFSLNREMKLTDREEIAFIKSGILTDIPTKIIVNNNSICDYVFFHYGASSLNKLVAKESFALILNYVSFFYPIVLSAMPSDLEYFKKAGLSNITFIRGSISEIADVLILSRAVIAHDTGFTHVAGLFQKRQYAFYGPHSPLVYGPRNNYANFYINPSETFKSCMPCGKKICLRHDNKHCLSDIEIYSVLKEIMYVINGSNVY